MHTIKCNLYFPPKLLSMINSKQVPVHCTAHPGKLQHILCSLCFPSKLLSLVATALHKFLKGHISVIHWTISKIKQSIVKGIKIQSVIWIWQYVVNALLIIQFPKTKYFHHFHCLHENAESHNAVFRGQIWPSGVVFQKFKKHCKAMNSYSSWFQ